MHRIIPSWADDKFNGFVTTFTFLKMYLKNLIDLTAAHTHSSFLITKN